MAAGNTFDRLDQSYLNGMVERAKQGSSNAFAELFASVADRQLWYLSQLFGSREKALEVMPEVFSTVYRSLPSLTKTDLFMPWICHISALVHMDHEGVGAVAESGYDLSQLLNLPVAESQVMLMSFVQGFSDAEIAGLMNVGRSTISRFIRLSRRHLTRNSAASGTARAERKPQTGKGAAGATVAGLTTHETSEILDKVFGACGAEGNTVPMETIASYTVYRTERFTLQRAILAMALLVFLMLPVLFIMPAYTVTVDENGERGLPVYTIDVDSLVPVGKVLASIKDAGLPVYEAGAREFTVEPTRNGELDISVELINHQIVSGSHKVSSVDANGPELVSSERLKEGFLLKVRDAGIGVDYREIYAVSASGDVIYPVRADEEGGVLFEYPKDTLDIYIPDHIGNTLHLSVKLR